MTKYRKLPVVIDAFLWTGDETQTEDPEWIVEAMGAGDVYIVYPQMFINTLEGVMSANVGDYIIKGVQDEIYPCKPDIFEKTYEIAE